MQAYQAGRVHTASRVVETQGVARILICLGTLKGPLTEGGGGKGVILR